MTKELLFSVSDFSWDTFRCGGKGGQNVNKRETGVRCTHVESGAVGKSCDERSQLQNRRLAFERCVTTPAFKHWLNKKIFHALESKELEEYVEREILMNTRIEVFTGGEWREEY